MRLVIAIGGNALLKRGQPMTAQAQRRNMHASAQALAAAYADHDVAIVHGNGPQVGLLAEQTQRAGAASVFPLDMVGAESQGMLGYLISQELSNAAPQREVIAVLSQTRVDSQDPAFARPTKPIGAICPASEAQILHRRHGWTFKTDGDGKRRVVASPEPIEIIEAAAIDRMVAAGVVVVCAGGGGIPVQRLSDGALEGLEAVIDKDLTAALLARRLKADRLVILTDVDAIYDDWGGPGQSPLRQITIAELRRRTFTEGSMAPKVQAVCGFVEATGGSAVVGALDQARAVMAGASGTLILP